VPRIHQPSKEPLLTTNIPDRLPRPGSERRPRRALLAGGLAALGAATLLAGCGGSSGTPPGGSGGAVGSGGKTGSGGSNATGSGGTSATGSGGSTSSSGGSGAGSGGSGTASGGSSG